MLSGTPEICDLKDDDRDGVCDDATPPSGESRIGAEAWYGATWPGWPVAEGSQGCDLGRGRLSLLPSGGSTQATEVCPADDIANRSRTDPAAPPPGGDGRWHPVRGVNRAGKGTCDSGDPSQAGPREAAIDAAPGSCP